MLGIMSDNDVGGQFNALVNIFVGETWKDLWAYLACPVHTFESNLGHTDATWRRCRHASTPCRRRICLRQPRPTPKSLYYGLVVSKRLQYRARGKLHFISAGHPPSTRALRLPGPTVSPVSVLPTGQNNVATWSWPRNSLLCRSLASPCGCRAPKGGDHIGHFHIPWPKYFWGATACFEGDSLRHESVLALSRQSRNQMSAEVRRRISARRLPP
jgi:hypothetical protein